MTCKQCGMTIGWDCECDPSYNELLQKELDHQELTAPNQEDN